MSSPFDFLNDLPSPAETESEAPKRRKKPANFTDTVTRLFQQRGYHIAMTEQSVMHAKYNPETKQRELLGSSKRDLFGFADFVAVSRDVPGTTFIQVCRKADIVARVRSACSHDANELPQNKKAKLRTNVNRGKVLTDILLAGNRFLVVGFEKVGTRWQATIVSVTLEVIREAQSGDRLTLAKMPKVTL